MKRVSLIFLLAAFLLTACGPEPEPTMSPADVQGTAIAAAWTMVAETQAAIPTATPIPPTEIPSATPLPTNTVAPLVLPTQALVIQPTATTASGTDECNKFLSNEADGPTFPLKIINETKAPANISLYLSKTPFGECGYRGYSVPKFGSVLVTFPQGVIYGYAWILEPINTTVSGGPWKPNNTDKWSILIREDQLKMNGP